MATYPSIYGIDLSPVVTKTEAMLGAKLDWWFYHNPYSHRLRITARGPQGHSITQTVSTDVLRNANVSPSTILEGVARNFAGHFVGQPRDRSEKEITTVMPNVELRSQVTGVEVQELQGQRVQVADFVSYNRDDGRFYKTSIVTYLDEEVDEHGNPIDELPF